MSTFSTMYGVQQYPYSMTPAGQFDPQGFIAALLAGAAGGGVGKHLGGSTGQTLGSWTGKIGGAVLPFEAEPAADAPPSDLEMQGFWSVIKKIGQGVGTGLHVGKSLGLFESAPPAQTAGVASQEQLIALQALPALQAIAQQAQLAPQTIIGPTPWSHGSSWLSKFLPRPVSSLMM